MNINKEIKNNIGNLVSIEYCNNGFKYRSTGVIKNKDNYNIYFKINDETESKIKRKNIINITKI